MADALIGAARANFHNPQTEILVPVADLSRLFAGAAELPRSTFERLVERMIERLDSIDGDPDMEDDDPDFCTAGDDDPAAVRPLPSPVFGDCEDDEAEAYA